MLQCQRKKYETFCHNRHQLHNALGTQGDRVDKPSLALGLPPAVLGLVVRVARKHVGRAVRRCHLVRRPRGLKQHAAVWTGGILVEGDAHDKGIATRWVVVVADASARCVAIDHHSVWSKEIPVGQLAAQWRACLRRLRGELLEDGWDLGLVRPAIPNAIQVGFRASAPPLVCRRMPCSLGESLQKLKNHCCSVLGHGVVDGRNVLAKVHDGCELSLRVFVCKCYQIR